MAAGIVFKQVRWKNFLSTGDQETVVDLNATNSTLIVGANGSGKSTLLDAISYALFGKAHRKINIPQLINSVNGKRMLVTLTFSIGKVEYKIVRGAKPNIFEIWQNGKMLNQEAHASDYQKILEHNIIKMNHKSFHQIVVLGSGNFIPFMQLSAGHRRNVIEDLLDINVFSKMHQLIKARVSNLRSEIEHNKNQIESAMNSISLRTKHIEELKAIDAGNIKQIQEEIEELENQITALEVLNTNLVDEMQSAIDHDTLNEINKKIKQLALHDGQIKARVRGLQKDIEFYENNDVCPTCNQDIQEGLKASEINRLKQAREELDEGLALLNEKSQELNVAYEEANAEITRVSRINTDITANNSRIAMIQASIKKAQGKLEKRTGIDTSDAEEALVQLHEGLNKLKKQKAQLATVTSYCSFIDELLKDNGIKAKIIKQYLPVINKLINQYLQVLDFFVSFNIDENFNETIRSRHRDTFTYASFSEGEKARIDLSLMFTWRQVARMKNSVSTNLLILDEVFDSSIDTDGADNLLKILGTLDDDTNVFIISHKTDILDGKFNRKIEFKKDGNFSKMTEF